MSGAFRELRSVLLSPVRGGKSRWGNHPHARMSLLSVLLFWTSVVTMLFLGLLQWAGHPLPWKVGGWTIAALLFSTAVSSCLDERRDRRLRVLPRQRRLR
jgi:hypothetical protein